MHKKSQVALEFLTTYAWAFVAISVTIAALYYFGALDFSRYLPQSCIFPSQLKCLDFSMNPSEIRIKLLNNIGENICVKSIQVTNDATPPVSCTLQPIPQGSCQSSEFYWAQSTEKDIVLASCSGGAYLSNQRAEVKISLRYYAINTPSKPVHLVSGKINGKVTS